ncbi:MAG: amidase, partial [Marinovum sp.]|nr:amidase [Marinovum sp.]
MNSIVDLTAAQQGQAIQHGKLDPVALTQTYLDAAEDHPQSHRIFTMLTPDRALAEARAAQTRARSGQRLSPLDGVPISWKDLFDTAGRATEAGSALLRGRIPERDAKVLRNASAMGLVCIGKTHMSELAFSGLGLNPMTESPPCVNDPSAVSGGSSSGAAASVAFGLAAAAIGSDTGGSVRIPAAWNDLVGLKTTAGSLPLDGVVPLCESFDTIGPLSKTVEDAALL